MKAIFLDDERIPADVTWLHYAVDVEWLIVRTQAQFMEAVKALGDEVELISFDHDIMDFEPDGSELTGYTCLKALVDHCFDTNASLPECVFHTQNPIGRENMLHYYRNAVTHLNQRVQP